MKNEKVVLVTNIPAPYREKVYQNLAEKYENNFDVVYCSKLETNRKWVFNYGKYKKHFLKSKTIAFGEKNFHFNFSIWNKLCELKPDVVITAGFALPMLIGFLWTIVYGKKHICFTDGTLHSEQGLTFFHRLARKIVFSKSSSFIGASNKSLELYGSYGVSDKHIFKSCLCVNNDNFTKNIQPFHSKKYDLLFSGQFTKRKMPFFFASVVRELSTKVPNLTIAIIGSGPLEEEFLRSLQIEGVKVEYLGFVQQDVLPSIYANAKFLLFPTMNDPWGVVANEAIASGCMVVTCDNSGVSKELVINDSSGLVLDLEERLWAENILKFYNDEPKYNLIINNGLNIVKDYNFESASTGIRDAIEHSIKY